ncbi:LysR family transcriptional regulator ['Paenibacillus yunnanensis' Narsing Rao et al. 2020]|uniref:LysR family transcriptional regulator n=1 Tax=Paenibacillus tengchongensis TaxID=2608684 RepID=UPI00124CAE60|nr:LysR family transcriptional regulator [Paenibacillus tengchongensis]
MESHDLRIFKQVAELKSISKAAGKLDYVQSNISQRIKSLEEELGVRLLIRNNRGVTLTEEGNQFLEYTRQILLLMDEAKSAVNPAKWKHSLAIGATQTISALRLPEWLSSFLRDNPIDVKLRTNSAERLQEMLSYGELDGIFVNGPYNKALFEPVYTYEEKVVIISPKLHPGQEPLRQTLLMNSDTGCVYRNRLLDIFKDEHMQNRAVMELDSLESILQAVNDGLGISVIPADIAYSRKELQSIQYEELCEPVRVTFLIKLRKTQSQVLKKFIRFLEETRIGQS